MQDPKESKRKRLSRIFLGISLGLNFLLIGGIAGALLHWPGGDHRRSGPLLSLAGLSFISQALDRDDHNAIREVISKRKLSAREHSREMDKYLERLIQLLSSDPFEPEKLDELFLEQRSRFFGLLEEGQSILADRIKAMSSEERSEFALRLENHHEHRGKKRRR